MEIERFFQFEIIINVLALAVSAAFDYICYRSAAIINIFYSFSAEIYRRQIVRNDSRAVRANTGI